MSTTEYSQRKNPRVRWELVATDPKELTLGWKKCSTRFFDNVCHVLSFGAEMYQQITDRERVGLLAVGF